jgi:hypothetical protein
VCLCSEDKRHVQVSVYMCVCVCVVKKEVNATQTERTAVQINNITLPYLILHVATDSELLVTRTVTTSI